MSSQIACRISFFASINTSPIHVTSYHMDIGQPSPTDNIIVHPRIGCLTPDTTARKAKSKKQKSKKQKAKSNKSCSMSWEQWGEQ